MRRAAVDGNWIRGSTSSEGGRGRAVRGPLRGEEAFFSTRARKPDDSNCSSHVPRPRYVTSCRAYTCVTVLCDAVRRSWCQRVRTHVVVVVWYYNNIRTRARVQCTRPSTTRRPLPKTVGENNYVRNKKRKVWKQMRSSRACITSPRAHNCTRYIHARPCTQRCSV